MDFSDIEPSLLPRQTRPGRPGTIRPLVKNNLFEVSLRQMGGGEALPLAGGRMEILGATEGALRIEAGDDGLDLLAGQFCLLPAQCPPGAARATGPVSFLQVHAG
jgi:hypothetical protein